MAQFRGIVQGCRGEVSRLGGKESGLHVSADGWRIGISVDLYHDKETGKDEAVVWLTGGSRGPTIRELGRFVETDVSGYVGEL